MTNQKSFKLEELAKLTDSLVIGDPECVIDNLSTISSASESSITFLTNPKYSGDLKNSKACAVLVYESYKEDKDFNNASFKFDNGKFESIREQEKMSKSKFNVVNPDEICDQYGADTLRMYEMFLGPIEQSKPWDTRGISGVYSFLKRFWNLFFENDKLTLNEDIPSEESLKSLHKTIKKINEDI